MSIKTKRTVMESLDHSAYFFLGAGLFTQVWWLCLLALAAAGTTLYLAKRWAPSLRADVERTFEEAVRARYVQSTGVERADRLSQQWIEDAQRRASLTTRPPAA